MKPSIHPRYETATVRCACGNEFVTRSTKRELSIALCNECHPFYTGKQKFVDTAGRIEKFQRRFNVAEGQGTVVREAKKTSLRQVQAAAIQEEKRQKAARKAAKRVDAPSEAEAAPAAEGDAPAEGGGRRGKGKGKKEADS